MELINISIRQLRKKEQGTRSRGKLVVEAVCSVKIVLNEIIIRFTYTINPCKGLFQEYEHKIINCKTNFVHRFSEIVIIINIDIYNTNLIANIRGLNHIMENTAIASGKVIINSSEKIRSQAILFVMFHISKTDLVLNFKISDRSGGGSTTALHFNFQNFIC